MKFLIYIFLLLPISTYAAHLNSEMSKRIAARAMKYAATKNWNISVAIFNSEGNLEYFERSDSAYVGSVSASIKKAESANAFRRPTSEFVEAIKNGRIGLMTMEKVVAIEGGVPIYDSKGKHIGAIGVSGAKAIEDEEVAKDAVKAILE